ncbi:MAG: HAD-IIIC family phosphatase [Anaerolineae bacterium]|nr:HAD-IIIC family phosphatase [Anaerolineae bacterium]
MANTRLRTSEDQRRGKIKCIVWDLDNTLWDGVLLEDETVSLREDVVNIIETLDRRGILQSIASKNDYHQAMAVVDGFGLADYFLYPQINWNSKASSIETIASAINIGLDTIAFIDDQPFEREEVNFSFPQILCVDATNLSQLLDMPEMNPRFITEDSRKRRLMVLRDRDRQKAEDEFVGPQEEFLASLGMILTILPAQEEDLRRAEELTLRTNQLNTSGYTYSYDALKHFCQSDQYQLLIAGLEDKYGTYGKIGLALVEFGPQIWVIKLLLMSCRVMSRGVGGIMINHIRQQAKRKGVRLQAEFVPNERNRMMYMTYKFAHFKEIEKTDTCLILENDLQQMISFPPYVKIK